jgi:hypothetical protein
MEPEKNRRQETGDWQPAIINVIVEGPFEHFLLPVSCHLSPVRLRRYRDLRRTTL